MLNNRHFISYFSTTLLYMTMTGLFLYVQQQTKVSTERSDEKVMKVMLNNFVPNVLPADDIPVIKEEEPEIKEEEVVEPEVEEEPIPPKEEEKVVEEPIPEPIVKPEPPKPEPVIEKPVPKKPEKKPVQKKKPVEKKKPKKIVKKKKPVQQARRSSLKKSQANPDEVNRFYKRVRVKINENKSYPKLAKRRRMQGAVKVTFTVLPSGNVSNISIKGPKVFHNSARNAVKSAFPISVKNIPVSLPATVNVTLLYQIR